MANRISAFGYLECSAKTKDGVREVFEMATRAALQVRKRKKRGGCQLLWRVCRPIGTRGRLPPRAQGKPREILDQWPLWTILTSQMQICHRGIWKTDTAVVKQNKINLLFCFLLFSLLLTHLSVCFVLFPHQHTSLLVWRTCPALIWMYVCFYMCIYFTNLSHLYVYREEKRSNAPSSFKICLNIREPLLLFKMYVPLSAYTSA